MTYGYIAHSINETSKHCIPGVFDITTAFADKPIRKLPLPYAHRYKSESIVVTNKEVDSQKISWDNEESLRNLFAQAAREELNLANAGMDEYTKTLAELD